MQIDKKNALALEQRNKELAALNVIAASINQTQNLDQALKIALSKIEVALGLQYSEIWLLDKQNNSLVLRTHRGLPAEFVQQVPSFKTGQGLAGTVAQTKRPLLITDLATNPQYLRQRARRYNLEGALGIPLLAQEQVVGVMNIFFHKLPRISTETITNLEILGHLIGTTIENARLFEKLQQQTKELSALYETALATGSVLDTDILLHRLREQTQKSISPDALMVALYKRDTNQFEIALACEREKIITPQTDSGYSFKKGGLFSEVMRSRQPLLVTDLQSHYVSSAPELISRPVRTWLGVPLIARNQIIGVVSIQSFKPYAFSQTERRFLEAIASQVAVALDNARLFESERRRRQEIEVVQRSSLSLIASLELPQVLEAILKATLNLIPAMDTHIFLYSDEKNLSFGAAMWADGRRLGHPFSEPRQHGLTYTVASSGKMIIVEDMKTHPLFSNTPSDWNGSILGIPLKIGNRVVGVMSVAFPQARRFSQADLDTLNLLAAQAAIAIENARLFERSQKEIDKRKETTEALRKSEEKYRLLIEQSNDAIYFLRNNRLELVNRKFEEIFGYSKAEVTAPTFEPMSLVAPKSRQFILERQKKQARGEMLPARYEFTALHKSGREVEIELSVSEFIYQDSMAVQGILRDVSDRKRFETQLRQAQKMEAISQLAGGIAHDFNNILMSINGLTSLSLKNTPPETPLHNDLKTIHSQTERAARLVNQLLTFAQRQSLETKPLNLNQVIRELSDLLQRAVGKNIKMSTLLADDLLDIHGDINALEQILTGLYLNAGDAMQGEGNIQITTQNIYLDEAFCQSLPSAVPGQYVLLSVSDTGGGMDEETLARIYDPFFTTKEVGKGTGLGLAVIFSLMQQLHGFIEVRSVQGQGSTFNLYFPATASSIEQLPSKHSKSTITMSSQRILLIEDEPVLRKVVTQVLERTGYQVTATHSGQKAFDLLKSGQIIADLIITDFSMPKMKGDELYTAVKTLDLSPEPQFIFISGYGKADIETQLQVDPATQIEFISKPFSSATLISKIKAVLNR